MKFKEIAMQWIGEEKCDRIILGVNYLVALIILNIYYWGRI